MEGFKIVQKNKTVVFLVNIPKGRNISSQTRRTSKPIVKYPAFNHSNISSFVKGPKTKNRENININK